MRSVLVFVYTIWINILFYLKLEVKNINNSVLHYAKHTTKCMF